MILAIKKYKVDSFISKYLSYQLEIFCIYLSLNISGYCTFSSNQFMLGCFLFEVDKFFFKFQLGSYVMKEKLAYIIQLDSDN